MRLMGQWQTGTRRSWGCFSRSGRGGGGGGGPAPPSLPSYTLSFLGGCYFQVVYTPAANSAPTAYQLTIQVSLGTRALSEGVTRVVVQSYAGPARASQLAAVNAVGEDIGEQLGGAGVGAGPTRFTIQARDRRGVAVALMKADDVAVRASSAPGPAWGRGGARSAAP